MKISMMLLSGTVVASAAFGQMTIAEFEAMNPGFKNPYTQRVAGSTGVKEMTNSQQPESATTNEQYNQSDCGLSNIRITGSADVEIGRVVTENSGTSYVNGVRCD